ncbi:MAG: type I DNA topoisomerase, partial [Endomicrobiales bacterium]
MPKYLVIVESPTKEKTISKFLGRDFVVKSSYGHIRDLPKSKLGVDVEKDFQPQYLNVPRAKKILPELKKLSEKSNEVYLATDYDREGEAIAWHLKEALKLPDEKVKRITFHEITPEAIKGSLKNPRKIDLDMVDSQQARRILDRLVGYKLSPLLWRKVKYGLSAGRVQSVAVRLICDREEEIEKFKPQEYWSIQAELKKQEGAPQPFLAALVAKGETKFDKLHFADKGMSDAVLKDLEGAAYRVAGIESKERKRSPFAPYTTSTMQQDASRRIYFSAAKTMKIAQSLYEGISLGDEGNEGLITYMRTDSVNIAEQARKEAKEFIAKKHGARFLPEKPRAYKTKTKGAQEAHEAIRPTSVRRTPDEMKKYLSPDEFKLYDLIWRRFVASQMSDALYDTMGVDIRAGDYLFRASGRTLKFSGFLEVYLVEDADEEKEGTLPPLSVSETLELLRLVPEQHFTEPPPRFNEASIIRALEEHGIGRPSTYAPIIHTILERLYVRLEQRRFYPTNLGRLVNEILKRHFPKIVDVQFTAEVEEELDQVAEGEMKWTRVVGEFYHPFEENLEEAEKNLTRQKVEPQKTSEVCPKCGKPMVLRDSRRGQFLACSGFPECRTTFSVDREGNKIIKPAPEMTAEVCEKCGKAMLKRIGKRGPFLAC